MGIGISKNKRKISFFATISFLLLITVMSANAQEAPAANFTSNVSEGIAPLDVQFNDSSLNATAWNWDFGDGNNSTFQNPINTYFVAGNYTVNLTASNENGTNTFFGAINVTEPVIPVANFTSNVSEGIAPLDVQFNDSSLNATALNWDFGDGNNSTVQNPVNTYFAAGNYTVNLTVSNENGTNSTFRMINVSELELPVLPLANFTSNVSEGIAPLDVQFNDSSLNATEWYWDFGDENNSTVKNPIHEYADPGNYTVNLTVSNVNGTNSTLGMINVSEPLLPIANFTSNVTGGNVPLTVQFNDSSLNATLWNWNFGDGNNSTLRNPINTYFAAGNYTVNLTVSNENGTNSTLGMINVSELELPVLPVANFTSNVSEGIAPLNVQFNDSSLNATEWEWDFGDGNNSTVRDPVHEYADPGNYTVNLTVSNGNGTNSTTGMINVSEPGPIPGVPILPVANFTSNVSSGDAPLSVQFNDSSLNSSEWYWDFGDGNNSTARNPINVYTEAGNYTVNLNASNENGTNSTFSTINVSEPGQVSMPVLPLANFTSNVSEGIAPLDVQFNDSSLNATEWYWDFGDGNNSTLQNPINTYYKAGNYTVNLTASNENGMDSAPSKINVSEPALEPEPEPEPTPGPAPGPEPEPAPIQPPKPLVINNITIINAINNTVINNVNIEEKCGCTPGGIAVNPEGTVIYVTNIYNNTVSIVNTVTNNVIATVNVGQYPSGIAVAGTKVYVTNFYSNTVSVIDITTNTVVETVDVGTCPTGIAVAGTKVYVTNIYSNTVSVIDITTNTIIATVNAGRYPSGVAVSPDGTKVYVTNVYSNTVSVIDTTTNRVTATVSVGNGPAGVAITGTKAYVTNFYGNTVSIIDITTNTVIATVDVGICPEGIIVSPDGTKVDIINSYSSTVYVIDATTNDVTITTGAESAFIASGKSMSSLPALQPATNAPPIIAGGNAYSSNVSIIDETTNNITATVNVGINHGGVAVSPDGTKVYATNLSSNTVSVIDVATNNITATVNVGNYPSGIAVSPDGTRVYVTNIYSNNVSIIDTATNNVTATVNAGSFPAGIAISPDGTKAYVTNVNNNTVSAIDTVTNRVTATITVGMYPWGIAVSPDGKRVYVTNIYSNTVSIIDTGTNRVIDTVNAGTWPWGVAVAGTKVYVANVYSNTVSVIDTVTNNVTTTVPVRTWPWGVTVAGTNAYVAYSGDRVVSLINTTTDRVTTTISGGNPPIPFGQSIGSLPALQPTIPVPNLSSNSTCWCISQTCLKL